MGKHLTALAYWGGAIAMVGRDCQRSGHFGHHAWVAGFDLGLNLRFRVIGRLVVAGRKDRDAQLHKRSLNDLLFVLLDGAKEDGLVVAGCAGGCVGCVRRRAQGKC